MQLTWGHQLLNETPLITHEVKRHRRHGRRLTVKDNATPSLKSISWLLDLTLPSGTPMCALQE